MSITLQAKNEREFPGTVRGSLVLGNYLYVMSDILYRVQIDDNNMGEPEPMNEVILPGFICTDGKFIYVTGRTHPDSNTICRVTIIDSEDFSIEHQHDIHGVGERIRKTMCDTMGFFHMAATIGAGFFPSHGWWIYKYDPILKSFTNVQGGGSGGRSINSIEQIEDKFVLSGYYTTQDVFHHRVYSWDGSNRSRLRTIHIQGDRLTSFEDKIISVISTSAYNRRIAIYNLDKDNNLLEITQNNYTVTNTSTYNVIVNIVSDGDYIYYIRRVDSRLYIVNNINNILSTNSILTFPEIFINTNIEGRDLQNMLTLGNNRLYVSNGNKIYILAWAVSARIEASVTSGRAPLPVTFRAV